MLNTAELRERCARTLEENQVQISQMTAFLGLDGFVDEIVHVVDQRQDAGTFTRLPTIQSLADRIGDASGRSTNLELVTTRVKIGGNGPIMANALASFGLHVTYLGALGHPNLHGVFEEFSRRAEVHSIAQPGHTDALEFQDGKIMASKLTPLNDVTWANIEERFGRRQFGAKLLGSQFVGFVNWTMIPHMSGIWERILSDICRDQPRTHRKIFFDLADPEKRTPGDIRHALELITRFGQYFDVILGFNEKEAYEVAGVLGIPETTHDAAGLAQLMQRLIEQIPVETLVVHPVRYAIAISDHQAQCVEGPYIARPLITTGAGDHFNAGFCLGKLLALDNPTALLCGVATSGFYVRNARSPAVTDLAAFLRDWPQA